MAAERRGRGAKLALVGVIALSVTAAYLVVGSAPAPAPDRGPEKRVAAAPEPSAPSAPPAPSPGPLGRAAELPQKDDAALRVEPKAPAGPPPQTIDPDVAALLAVYDEMAELMESSPDDCDALAYGLSTIMDAAAPGVRALLQRGGAAPAQLDPAVRADATARLKRLGSAMNVVLPRCAKQLNEEMARMRELSGQPASR